MLEGIPIDATAFLGCYGRNGKLDFSIDAHHLIDEGSGNEFAIGSFRKIKRHPLMFFYSEIVFDEAIGKFKEGRAIPGFRYRIYEGNDHSIIKLPNDNNEKMIEFRKLPC